MEYSAAVDNHKTVIDISSLFSGMIGAVIGGVCTYLASIRLETSKRKDLVKRLHNLFISEISGHQAILANFLELVMPYWLYRGALSSGQDINLIKIPTPRSILINSSFVKYSQQLIESNRVVSLINYYDAVLEINYYIEEWNKAENKTSNITSAIYLGAQLLKGSIDAVEDLLRTPGIKKYFSPRLEEEIENFKSQKSQYLFLIALSKLKESDLMGLYYYRLVSKSDEMNVKYERMGLSADPDKIKQIPEIILKAPDRAWEQYLRKEDLG